MRIEWNLPGQRFFETGVDRGVLYPRNGVGVPWNGLVAINEDASGGDVQPLYFDGKKYLDIVSAEDFTASLEAYSSPREFDACDGTKMLSPGLFVGQQPRQTFGLCYRTLVGNDLQGEDYGYKLHIVYNITASPAGRSHKTIAGAPDPGTRTWTLNTVPPPATTFRPTAHIVVDSTLVDPYLMAELESQLYGREATDGLAAIVPTLPTVQEIVVILGNRVGDTIDAFI